MDIRGEQIGRRTKVDLGLVGDVKATLQGRFFQLLSSKRPTALIWTNPSNIIKRRGRWLDDLATGNLGVKPIHPQYVARVLDEVAAEDAIFSCDVGTPTIWAARYLTMNGKRRLLGSFSHGSMANALSQAIGRAGFPPETRQVVTLSGDGGIAMLLGDLLTLRQLRLPVKIVVFNNGSYGFVELEMKAAGILDFATDLHNPDFAKIAEAADVLGLKAETPEQVRPMLVEALQHDGPALVDVVVNRQELSMPPTIQAGSDDGLQPLYMIKAVLDGRGTEILDLAKTNLLP